MLRKWNIGWGTVGLCNMNCQFCYSREQREESTDLDFSEWRQFIEENNGLIATINYGTGENSLSDDWFRLIDFVRSNYPTIRQSVTTNGYLSEQINKSNEKKEIVVRSIDEIDISLDFYEPEKHNSFRGQPHAFEWAINMLDLCKVYGKQSTIVCLGSKVNMYKENIDGLFRIAKRYDSLFRINIYRPTEGINTHSSRFILEPKNLYDILEYINEKYVILSISDALLSSIFLDETEQDPSGIDSLRILPNGDISPSTYLIDEKYIIGNSRDKRILEKLSRTDLIKSVIHEVVPEECKNCIYSFRCKGGVYDRRLLWNGTLEKKDPYCLFSNNNFDIHKLDISKETFSSVHHGYLPTMFFRAI